MFSFPEITTFVEYKNLLDSEESINEIQKLLQQTTNLMNDFVNKFVEHKKIFHLKISRRMNHYHWKKTYEMLRHGMIKLSTVLRNV